MSGKKLDADALAQALSEEPREGDQTGQRKKTTDHVKSRKDYDKPVHIGKQTIYELDPNACTVWEHNPRNQAHLTKENCAEIIDSIRENGQKLPVLAREISLGKFQIIYGSRRRFAAAHLGIKLKAIVEKLDDKEALIRAHTENEQSKENTPYEIACSHAKAMNSGIFESQAEYAQKMMIHKSKISRIMAFANLPVDIVEAYTNEADLVEGHVQKLGPLASKTESRNRMIEKAQELKGQGLKGQAVYQALLKAGRGRSKTPVQQRPDPIKVPASKEKKKDVLVIQKDQDRPAAECAKITINVYPSTSTEDRDKIKAELHKLIEEL